MLDKGRNKTVQRVIEQIGFVIRGLCEALAAAAAGAKTDRSMQTEKIVMGDFECASSMFEFLVSDAVRQQDRLRVLDLNQDVANSRSALIERHDFNAREQSGGVQPLLRFE